MSSFITIDLYYLKIFIMHWHQKKIYNDDDFYDWIVNQFLSHCNVFSISHNVIVLNNFNVHLNVRVIQTIEKYNCKIRFLSFYSSNYNFIEFIFSILKIWMRRHFRFLRRIFENNFETFLRHVLKINDCDKFVVEHFRHNARNYKFENDFEIVQRKLKI